MQQRKLVALVDSDPRRRAAVSRELTGEKLHIEPYESAHEFVSGNPQADAILTEDDIEIVGEVLEALARAGRFTPLLVMSEVAETKTIVRVIHEGAADFLLWPFTADSLLDALPGASQMASAGGAARLREARARGRLEKLTNREREVLSAVAGGLSNRMIGERLAISPRTVEIHRANMLLKIGASHTSEAIRVAVEAALVA